MSPTLQPSLPRSETTTATLWPKVPTSALVLATIAQSIQAQEHGQDGSASTLSIVIFFTAGYHAESVTFPLQAMMIVTMQSI